MCVKTVYMDGNPKDIAYKKGKIYVSDVNGSLKDENGNNYNINKFGLEFLKFARSIGLQITRSTANNTLVITFK